MKMKYPSVRDILSLCSIALLISNIACKGGPDAGDPIPLETEVNMADAHKDVVMDMRKIKVLEAVPTTKYLYLNVSEGDREYWMATGPTEVETGAVYYYNEALIRADFESKEMQKVFDTIYLVTRIVPEAEVENLKPVKSIASPPEESANSQESGMMGQDGAQDATAVRIADVLNNPGAFQGRWVEVSGTCTKVNEGILNRNWIHLKDGSADDKDFVITSAATVKPGDIVKIQAVVHLDKDFGAGYKYAVILEDGVVLD
jgi:hypothetical protein